MRQMREWLFASLLPVAAGWTAASHLPARAPRRCTDVCALFGRGTSNNGDSREDLLKKLYEGTATATPSPEIPSHLSVEYHEDGEPVQARFTYVDEDTCIGCKHCAFTARNTFFMEDEGGRARVYDQSGDTEELVLEAIDTCPVNCIHFVSHEDLVTLEQERIEREESISFNNYGDFKKRWVSADAGSFGSTTSAKFYEQPGIRCDNCPSRGCAECPMFGVGQNPTYLARLEERAKRKEASGEAAAARQTAERDALLDGFYAATSDAEAGFEDAADFGGEVDFGDLFGGGYAMPDLDDGGGGFGGGGLSKLSEEELRASLAELDGAILQAPQDVGLLLRRASVFVALGEGKLARGEYERVLEIEPRNPSAREYAVQREKALDPYATLGLRRSASLTDVKRAFRKLAKQYHPDRNADRPEGERLEAEQRFKDINLANEVLTDGRKRRQYDSGDASVAELVVGFWEQIRARMDERPAARGRVGGGGGGGGGAGGGGGGLFGRRG